MFSRFITETLENLLDNNTKTIGYRNIPIRLQEILAIGHILFWINDILHY